MVRRPTATWREDVAADATAAELFPEEMIAATDEVLARFEADVAGLAGADREIFAVIERTVRALNVVNDRFGGVAYETGERELLCAYIEDTLDAAGLNVDGFAGRHRMTRHEITDQWREW